MRYIQSILDCNIYLILKYTYNIYIYTKIYFGDVYVIKKYFLIFFKKVTFLRQGQKYVILYIYIAAPILTKIPMSILVMLSVRLDLLTLGVFKPK